MYDYKILCMYSEQNTFLRATAFGNMVCFELFVIIVGYLFSRLCSEPLCVFLISQYLEWSLWAGVCCPCSFDAVKARSTVIVVPDRFAVMIKLGRSKLKLILPEGEYLG